MMKRLLCALLSRASAALLITPLAAVASPREHLSLDVGWKFHLGDDWPGALHLDKAGANTGPAADHGFTDATWRTPTAPPVVGATRLYGITPDGRLAYVEERAHSDIELSPHASAALERLAG